MDDCPRRPFQSAFDHRHWLAIGALLTAALLRALPLLSNRFHPDEALYAYFGRLIASGRDGLLAQVVVDKPPLAFYLMAGSFALVGPSELAARLPTMFASLMSVALAFALARRLYGWPAALLTAWLFGLSPLAILFSVTLFVDPLLTTFLLWGLWMATAGCRRWAGLGLALAFAVKQTALFFIPLALALPLIRLPAAARLREAVRELGAASRPLIVGLALAALLISGWDALRQHFGAPIGFWEQGYSDNAPNRLVRSGEVPLRAQAWLELLGYLTASPPFNGAFVVGLPALLAAGLRRPSRAALVDLLLAGFLIVYLAAYWLLAFNVWDRYLVPVAPLIVMLLARVLSQAADWAASLIHHLWKAAQPLRQDRRWERWLAAIFLALCILALMPSAMTAARSGYPVGGDHGAYLGLDDTARFLNALPYGAVLYDFWLSWEWNYYLFDGKVYVAWMPSPEALTTDLRSFGRTSPRYLAVPSWESEAEARAAADQAGYRFAPVHESFRPDGSRAFVVYQLVPASP